MSKQEPEPADCGLNRDLVSQYIDVAAIAWQPTRFQGVEMKVLFEEKSTGLLTALFRFAPRSLLPIHEHVEIEQTYVLSGSLRDHDGEVTAGNYVWRPKGNRHEAYSPDGAVVLSFFLRPNLFLDSNAQLIT